MENKEEIIFRLAKPKRKGLLPLIFSRFLIVALLFIIQLVLVMGVYTWLKQDIWFFSGLMSLFTLVMVVLLFNSDMDATAKLTWMLLIALFPLPGAAFLAFTQTDLGHNLVKLRIQELNQQTCQVLEQDEKSIQPLREDGSGVAALARYLNRTGSYPVYTSTEVRYFPSGEEKFQALLEELKKAERFIFLEYFIIEEGYMWGEILKILIEKAQAGVDVRVMYDGMYEMSTLPGNYPQLLEAQGIKAKAFLPITPIISSYYNYRDHRKILVIDGKVAFNGGVNLADEYINRIERFGHWKDTAVMLKGPAVRSFTLMFLNMWNLIEKDPEYLPYLETEEEPVRPDQGWVIPYADCPLDEYKAGETVYMDILNRAQNYVHIMTPYLILDGEMMGALKYAAQRGVDVKIILPGIPDKPAAWALAKSHYQELLSAGVQVYEYTPGFVHAKVFVSDDEKAVTGTINLDYRSLYHHFECATFMYRTPCIADMERDFQQTLALCRPVTPETIKNESLRMRLTGSFLKFIAPLM